MWTSQYITPAVATFAPILTYFVTPCAQALLIFDDRKYVFTYLARIVPQTPARGRLEHPVQYPMNKQF